MEKRRPFIAGNWKMFKTCAEAIDAFENLDRIVQGVSEVDVMIAAPFTALAPIAEKVDEATVKLGAQNFHWEKEGAYTGEISAAMLLSAGCTHVIIGHSERRQYFGETDETVNKKIRTAVENGLIPVMCVGETEKERDEDQTFSVLDKQVQKGLEGFLLNDLSSLIIAYEPVWAIGTGRTATADQAQEVHHYIRTMIGDGFGAGLAQGLRILYGGSVKPGNISELMGMPDIDGALVGGASLDPETFGKIVMYE